MTWKEAHRLAMLAAGRLHRQLGVNRGQWIDVFGVIESIGLLLAFRPLARISGAYIYNPRGTSGVVINASEPLHRQRYTAAHELGHHVFKHGTRVDKGVPPQSARTSAFRTDDEKLAEAFAEWFLMPRALTLGLLTRVGTSGPLTASRVYGLSLRLGTSYDATLRHLVSLRVVTPNQATKWLSISPKRIKQSLIRGAALHDWHQDVWDITNRDLGTTLSVRRGDRLIVSLEEVPTSGYLWEWLNPPPGITSSGDGYEEFPSQDAGEKQPPKADFVAGSQAVHWFAIDVEAETSIRTATLAFAKRRPWEGQGDKERVDFHIEVEEPRMGVRENLLALSGR